MKRVAQLFLILLALTTVNLAAKPHKGGSLAQAKPHKSGGSLVQTKAEGYGYYCYSDGFEADCGNLSSCYCRAECDKVCGGTCDWDGSCIIT